MSMYPYVEHLCSCIPQWKTVLLDSEHFGIKMLHCKVLTGSELIGRCPQWSATNNSWESLLLSGSKSLEIFQLTGSTLGI